MKQKVSTIVYSLDNNNILIGRKRGGTKYNKKDGKRLKD